MPYSKLNSRNQLELCSASFFIGINSNDAKLAAQHGVLMKTQYSKTIGESYIANTCRRCGKFVGGHYLFTGYIAIPEYPRQELDAGYYCPGCQI